MADEPVRQSFETLMVDHMRSVSERIGGIEQSVSEMQSIQKDQSEKINQIGISVDRLEIAVGVNGNGIVGQVEDHGLRLKTIETRNTVSDTTKSVKRELFIPWRTLFFMVLGGIIVSAATLIITGAIK